MSVETDSAHRAPSTLGPGSAYQRKSVALVPTNNVTTKDGVTVRVRIDVTLTVDEVIRQLVINLKLKENASYYALRNEADELVTDDNLRKNIKAKANLKIANAPAIEADGIIVKLCKQDESLRYTLFSLQKFIREPEFAQEFLMRDGLNELVNVIATSHGNTLAYALSAMQNLLELEYGWSSLEEAFIYKIVQILASSQSLINVCRPATAILKKLVEADPMTLLNQAASSSTAVPEVPENSVYRYGFTVVFNEMRKEKALLETVINRLGSADTQMALNSMMLMNSLLSHASDARWEEFVTELERLNVCKAVVRLMSSHTIEDLTSCILDFQANIVRVTYRKKVTLVEPDEVPAHDEALNVIWTNSALTAENDPQGGLIRWRKLGFETENVTEAFEEAGVLGLDCLKAFAKNDSEYFSKVCHEQLSRPAERRCPIGQSSNEVAELLADHWQIFAPGYSTSTSFQPFFLDFHRVHALALKFFLRMWNESGATKDDFPRVVALARSQVAVALRKENARPWHEVEADFLESEYRAVRDRQMKELEMEDDLMNKVPVRNLRAKLYKESFEFVKTQRIQCLMQGAWFVNGVATGHGAAAEGRRNHRPWRFMRLDNGHKYIHYVDSQVKFPVRNGLEDLPERIDISIINEIAIGTCIPPPSILRAQSDLPPSGRSRASPLSFSMLTADGSIADQIAPDQSRWADWTDGLNMLRRDSGHVASEETKSFVDALTEIGLKIKLLDLSGEKIEIPSGLIAGPPPPTTDFFFSDL